MATIKQAVTESNVNQTDLVAVLQNLRDAVNALRADHNTLVAKMNLDAGITDTNYAVTTASAISLNP